MGFNSGFKGLRKDPWSWSQNSGTAFQ